MIVLPLNCAVTDRIAKGIRFEQEPRPMTVVSIDSIYILLWCPVEGQKEVGMGLWYILHVQPMPKGFVLSEHEFHCATQEKLGVPFELNSIS